MTTKHKEGPPVGSTGDLYNEDFYAWTQEQAALLEARQFAALDIPNLVEEVTSLGVSDRRALTSHLIRLVMHLLKWCHQPAVQSASWRGNIRDARLQSSSCWTIPRACVGSSRTSCCA